MRAAALRSLVRKHDQVIVSAGRCPATLRPPQQEIGGQILRNSPFVAGRARDDTEVLEVAAQLRHDESGLLLGPWCRRIVS